MATETIRSNSLLVVIAIMTTGCAPAPTPAARTMQEKEPTMSGERSSSRPAPPSVPAVVRDGVRYEQVMNGLDAGLDTLTGNLAAYDAASGQRLWTLSVYHTSLDERRETDVQAVYFREMAFDADGRLRIVNERGDAFLVDVTARSVTAAPPR